MNSAASLRLKTLLKISSDSSNDIITEPSEASNRNASPHEEPEVERKKVPFYCESLYESKSKKHVQERRLFAADGSAGYGGHEFIQETYNEDNAPEPVKYKWQVLWKGLDEQIRKHILCDSVSLFSITDIKCADLISKAILSLSGVDSSSSITDATACIGGNTFSFLKYFRTVTAIELDVCRAEILRKNISLFKCKNVNIINGDCLEAIPNLPHQDVIFFDPPWGGKNYKKMKTVKLFLSNQSIGAVIKSLVRYTKYFAIKIPAANVNESEIVLESECTLVSSIEIGRKLKLVTLKSSAC